MSWYLPPPGIELMSARVQAMELLTVNCDTSVLLGEERSLAAR